MSTPRTTRWTWLGRVDYAAAAALQVEIREALARGDGPERLLLLEHPHVYTLGRNASERDVLLPPADLAARGVTVAASDRGGQVTYHGPGQLVGYPILDLSPDRRDLRRYVRDLQEVLVRTLAAWGLAAQGGEGERIGVWTPAAEGGRKIASLGIHLSRWRTTHGFALNVAPELGLFGGIVACGLPAVEMTSMARELGAAPPLHAVAARVVAEFGERFGRELVEDPEFAARPSPAAAGERA
ncbi:MAG: lipoyl(octanoyl) transferase LipB [Thermoanaerobaculia bacterium]|nr:lipoyl(octanoyl) transferase LipB [Thermoanaerobaculia bacterium]